MKGIILNLVEDVLRQDRGDDYWDDVVDRSGLAAAYTSLGTYPDQDVEVLARVIADRERTSTTEVIRHAGHAGLAMLAVRYPAFFTPHDDLRSFLLSLNTVVHPEVRRLYPGAVIPEFEHRFPEPDVLELVYVSERGRCDLAEGLVLGAADHYREAITVTQPSCTRRGDDACVIRVATA
ncbi:MAG TPA: heme NO-binding domain-containing protein [Candidatus Nanopelagicales bacterium]|nr:heme NO-binding domain-containing protein [Candidatus Nanopelagicales bacterium]